MEDSQLTPPAPASDASNPWDRPEREMLAAMVRSFAARELAPHLDEWERAGEVPRKIHLALGALGVLGAGFPEAVGGSGNIIDALTVTEEIVAAGGSSGLCAALLTHGIALPHIVRAGDPAQIAKYVLPTIAGELIGSLAITEPDAGSDVANIATSARRVGDKFIVNGSKTYITSGVRCDFAVVAVRTGEKGRHGISLLIIDKGTPGFQVVRKLEKMGWLCSDTAELAFSDVEVPVSNLVGAQGTGFAQIMANFTTERLSMAAQAAAVAKRCVEISLAWAMQRKSFGEPLTNHQVIRHKLAEMARQATVATSFVHEISAAFAQGREVGTEIAMAKNTAVFALDYVVNEAVQLHGGLGFMRGTEVERHYRDAKVMGIGGGTNEIMNEIIAKRMGI